MGVLVSAEEDIWVLEQLHPDHVAHRVVLLVDREDGGVGHLADSQLFIELQQMISLLYLFDNNDARLKILNIGIFMPFSVLKYFHQSLKHFMIK